MTGRWQAISWTDSKIHDTISCQRGTKSWDSAQRDISTAHTPIQSKLVEYYPSWQQAHVVQSGQTWIQHHVVILIKWMLKLHWSMGHCGVRLCDKIHYLDSTCSGLLLKCWWAHIQSHCVYNTYSHLHTHFSEIWYEIKNGILGRTVLTTWLMISLHWFRWLFGISWDNGFLSEFVTCMLDATLLILPWMTHFRNTFSTYDTLINTHCVDKCNAFNFNRQKALNILIWHIY